MKPYFAAWRKSFDFKGRSTRKEYWIFFIIACILIPIIFGLLAFIQFLSIYPPSYDYFPIWFLNIIDAFATGFSYMLLPISLGHTWTFLPLTVRRIRDVGMKWQWIFFVSIPLVGFIFVLIFLTRNSVEEINGKKYSPKYWFSRG